MKQKIVMKVQMHCDKSRAKAMKIAAVADGVSKVEIAGAEKDHLVVIGDGVDSVKLTCKLRKKLGHAIVVKVEEVKEEKKPNPNSSSSSSSSSWVQYPQAPVVYEVVHDPNPTVCSIL